MHPSPAVLWSSCISARVFGNSLPVVALVAALANAADGTPLDSRVDRARRGDFELKVLGPDGRSLAGATVEIELERHEFLFGCNIYAFDRFEDPFRNQNYKRAFDRVFNFATLPFYWKSYESRRGQPRHERTDRILEWCAARGITAKGHPLVWTNRAGVPDWLRPLAPLEVRTLVEARVRDTVKRFAGRMSVWDVVNEPVHTPPFGGFENRVEQITTVFGLAHEADPQAKLVLNEYHVLSEVTDFFSFAKRCLEAGARIDAFGLQAHEPRVGHFEPERVRRELERFATLGKELHLTEVTFPSGGQRVLRRSPNGRWRASEDIADEEWQARALEDLLREAFAHPQVTAFTWWDLADAHSWLPGGGLLREDLSPKPAYRLLDRLVNEAWHTHERLKADSEGSVRFRGFFGHYTVRAPEGRSGASVRVLLSRAGRRKMTVRLRAAWQIAPAEGDLAFDAHRPVTFIVEGPGPLGKLELRRVSEGASSDLSVEDVGAGRHLVRTGALTPGSWRLGVGATEAARSAQCSFAVLETVDAALPNNDGSIAVDAALAWLAADRSDRILALARRAGVRWVRERMSWSQVEPRPGEWSWGHYDRVASQAQRHGVNVYQIFHDAPAWSRRDGTTKRLPADLRAVYRFARAAGEHFHGRIQAWEVWNEPDIAVFADEPADQYAAVLKAASLGFKDADPALEVLMGSLAMAPGSFAELLLENETAQYFDVYNYHAYLPLERYPQRALAHRRLRERFGIETKPVWLTEAGIALRTPSGQLDEAQELRQARFLPRAYAESLAEDTTRHFFFVLPWYYENGVQFGLLERDGAPRPALAALAGLAAAAGNARGARRLEALPEGIRGVLVSRGDGRNAAILWSEKEDCALDVPRGVEVRDLYGRRIQDGGRGESVSRLALGQDPIYLVGRGDAFAKWKPASPRAKVLRDAEDNDAPSTKLRHVVLRFAFPIDAASKKRECWVLGEGGVLEGKVQVYNFGDRTVRGTVRVRSARALAADPEEQAVEVEPGGLAEVAVRVVAGESPADAPQHLRADLRVLPQGEGPTRRSSASVARVALR